MNIGRLVASACLALAILPVLSVAQMPQILERPPKPWPQVMVVGTVHLDNPGADVLKTKLDDVLAPERQRQIEAVVASLARFRPTKIAIEHVPEREPRDNDEYQRYLAGTFELTRGEAHQIGFRLARTLGHTRVYGIDHALGLDFDAALKYAAANGQQEILAEFTAMMQKLDRHFAELYARGTIGKILAAQNDDAQADDGVALYQLMSRIGKGASYVGADVASDWYKRNLRIYTNILRIIEAPSDRVLVLIGGGHRPLLRQLFVQSPGYEFVPTLPYLESAR